MKDHYWLERYSGPCRKQGEHVTALPRFEEIRSFVNNSFSHENILRYFLDEHNKREFKRNNFLHLLCPYVISDVKETIKTTLRKPFWKIPPTIFPEEKTFKLEKIESFKQGGIIITHLKVVDYLPDDSLIKQFDYIYKK